MKKVLLIILFVIILGAGIGGTTYFYIQNKNQISANEQLAQQNAQVQAQLNAIGQMVEVYEVSKTVYSGNEILDGDLVAVSVPASTLSTSSVTDKTLLVGRHYRVDVKPGTILSLDMLMDEDTDTAAKFPYEITLNSVPVSTVVGDYIDIRMVLATGEEYTVLTHKKVERLLNDVTITINVSEEEQAILISLFNDLGIYENGCLAYVTKYIEPGNSDSIAFYPVQHDMENFIRFNPNIEDTTRCINETLRDHIDEVLLKFTKDDNTTQSSAFMSAMKTQLTGQLAAQQTWITDHTDENGNFVGENGNASTSTNAGASTDTNAGTGTDTAGSTDQSFDQQVGEATDQLEQDLEAIQ